MTYWTSDEEGKATVLHVKGELDAVSAADLRPTLDRLATSGTLQVVVDLSELRLIDSSGVGAIVSLYKRLRALGGSLVVRGVRDQPLAIFRLLKLDRVLLPPTEAAA